MLTPEQIKLFNELITTIEVPRYKELVVDAVENWKTTKHPPITCDLGVIRDNKSCLKEDLNGNGCCLLGAYSIGKDLIETRPGHFDDFIYNKFTKLEVDLIIQVFDNNSDNIGFQMPGLLRLNEELVRLTQKVRIIALGLT